MKPFSITYFKNLSIGTLWKSTSFLFSVHRLVMGAMGSKVVELNLKYPGGLKWSFCRYNG